MNIQKIALLTGLLAAAMVNASVARSQDADSLGPRHAQLKLIADSWGDSVVIRFAVSTPGAWVIANKAGYVVERVQMSDKGDFDRTKYQRMTPEPLKPWPIGRWKSEFAGLPDSDALAPAIAAQMIFGKPSTTIPRHGKDVTPMVHAAQELEDRFGFALFAADIDARAAEASGLRVVDRGVHIGESYIYRAFVAQDDKSYRIDTGYIIVHVSQHAAAPAPFGLRVDSGDGKLRLHWSQPEQGGYSGYHVYRSENGGTNFKRLTRSPVVAMRTAKSKGPPEPSFTDTTVVDYRRYHYYVRGITSFGILSDAAEIEAYPRDLTPAPAPVPDDPIQNGKSSVKINWTTPHSSPDLNGFLVARSANSLSGFHFLMDHPLAKNERSFVDNNATADEPYYLVASIDTAGNEARSIIVAAEIIDSAPPSIPTGLTGTMDTNGVVRLRWKLGPERSIIGYRVLWANDPKHEFTQRTPTIWADTTFVDTVSMHTLTPYVYYRVASVNIRRSHSEMSNILAVKRPDLIAPTSSIFTDVKASDSSAELSWAHSESADVKYQVLYRKTVALDNVHTDAWKEIARLDRMAENYSDTKVVLNTTYQYELVVFDSTGNASKPSPIVQVRPYDRGTRPRVENVSAKYDVKTKRIHLTWSYPTHAEDYYFLIYRSVDGRPIAQYQAIPKSSTGFDDVILQNGKYVYEVKVHARIGAESPLSERAELEVR